MNDLLTTLQKLGNSKMRLDNFFSSTSGTAAEHSIGVKPHANRVYSLMVSAGIGKDKDPIIAYDGNLQVALNKKKFFSTNIGLHFLNQRKRVVRDVMQKPYYGTFMFSDIYGLQKARTFRPRLWTINFRIDKEVLHGTAVFGHCDLFPMLPYEILGAAWLGDWLRHETGMREVKWGWFFHSISNNKIADLRPQPMFEDLYDETEALEALRLEGIVRNIRPQLRPMPSIPLSGELDDFVTELFDYWRKK